MKILHDSRLKQYREPFGAAEAGTKVSLSLYIEDEQPESVQLMLWHGEDANPQFIEMKDNGDGRFSAGITVPDEGFKSPLSICTRVDLPEPVCPIMPTKSPCSISRLRSSTALWAKGVPGE